MSTVKKGCKQLSHFLKTLTIICYLKDYDVLR